MVRGLIHGGVNDIIDTSAMGVDMERASDGTTEGFASSLEESTPPATFPSSNSHNKNRSRKFLPNNGGNGGRGGSRSKRASSTSPLAAEEEENACYTKEKPALSSWRRARRGAMDTYRRRSLRIALCLGAGLLALDFSWRMYGLFGSADGIYTPALGAVVGSDGPEQVHLAYSGVDADGNPTGMTVMWSIGEGETPPVVQYGLSEDELTMEATGETVQYFDTVHHRVNLENLEPGTRFFYRCGHSSPAAKGDASAAVEDGKWSDIWSFLAAPNPQRWSGEGPWNRPVTVAVVADMGQVNAAQTFERLHQLSEEGEVDFVLHAGDISYADDAFLERTFSFGYEDKWDTYMRRVSDEFGTRLPYMVVPGNHEAECHSPACQVSPRKLRSLGRFQAYNARFRMPSLESQADHGTAMWYSFNLGPVHWVVIDTETDFPEASDDRFTWYSKGNGGFGDQLAWLEEDLARADQERNVRPWIIVSGHRPMYSRVDFTLTGKPGGEAENVRKVFEPLFEKYKADLYLSGHVHSYERSYPVIDGEVRFSEGSSYVNEGGGKDKISRRLKSTKVTYDEPAAPVHIVNGAGGNIEGFTMQNPIIGGKDPEWFALSLTMVGGVSILTFPSMNEIRSSFLTSESPGRVLDELTIRRKRAPSAR